MSECAFLVLDPDEARAGQVAAAVRAAGSEVVCFGPERPTAPPQPWSAILLGAPDPDAVTETLMEWLLVHRARGPVYTYGDEREAQLFCRSARVASSRHLGWPLDAAIVAPLSAGVSDKRSWPIGRSEPMRRIHRLIRQVGSFDTSVLITGESGTGKELVARSIHGTSARRGKLFVPINCGAIPSELLESELFGHEKGAFTGAITTRQGRFEIAEGGTLFLDEIGDMSLNMQVKLLRVLQERCFERVGSNHVRHCDVRIIAATHRNLEALVEAGGFREDLYYRLNVFPIEVPPLRDRVDDLALLIAEMTRRNALAGIGAVAFSPEAAFALESYHWPGNVRELGNLVERLTILCPNGVAGLDDLPSRYRSGTSRGSIAVSTGAELLPEGGIDLKLYLGTIEARLIQEALQRCGGTVAEAARMLGVRRTTLIEKLRRH